MNIDMSVFQQTFFEETEDILADLEKLLLRLASAPNEPELLNTIFRCAHSIKGGSATFGFADMARFTHSLETLLDLLRNGKAQVDTQITHLLLESLDQLKALLAVARGAAAAAKASETLIFQIEEVIALTGYVEEEWDEDALRAEIAQMLVEQTGSASAPDEQPAAVPDADAAPSTTFEEFFAPTPAPTLAPTRAFDEIASDENAANVSAFDVSASTKNAFDVSVPVAKGETQAKPSSLIPYPSSLTVSPSSLSASVPAGKSETQTLRVATDKIDKLINLVGELIINQSMLNEVVQNFSMAKLPRLREAVAEMERASRELQERVMAVRMLPIKYAFGRFPRLVYDLATICGKKVELRTSGEDTELDKSVIEAIADPLTHLIRNSVDHGLETPEERRDAGKAETGIIALNAFHEGGSIVIEVSDDGRGLNGERILRKAIERGLLLESDPPPPDETLYNFIFHPGFSTAPQVTDLSGRGVGMDIVKQSAQSLGGSITLLSTPGHGTRFRIRLPLTMAILEGLSVLVGEEVYVLPLTSIVESIRPKAGEIRMLAGQREVALVRGEALPIMRLYQVFGAASFVTDPTRGLLVIVENAGLKVALLVDKLIGQSQVVVKSLETNYRKVEGIAGATIMGDGRVALIMDVPALIQSMRTSNTVYRQAA